MACSISAWFNPARFSSPVTTSVRATCCILSARRALVSAAVIESRSTRNMLSVIELIVGIASIISKARMRMAYSERSISATITGVSVSSICPMASGG